MDRSCSRGSALDPLSPRSNSAGPSGVARVAGLPCYSRATSGRGYIADGALSEDESSSRGRTNSEWHAHSPRFVGSPEISPSRACISPELLCAGGRHGASPLRSHRRGHTRGSGKGGSLQERGSRASPARKCHFEVRSPSAGAQGTSAPDRTGSSQAGDLDMEVGSVTLKAWAQPEDVPRIGGAQKQRPVVGQSGKKQRDSVRTVRFNLDPWAASELGEDADFLSSLE